MYGLAPGSYDGTYDSWRKLVFPEDFPVVNAAIERAAETGDLAAEYRVVHRAAPCTGWRRRAGCSSIPRANPSAWSGSCST